MFHHFPMVFLWVFPLKPPFSYGFPIKTSIFPWDSASNLLGSYDPSHVTSTIFARTPWVSPWRWRIDSWIAWRRRDFRRRGAMEPGVLLWGKWRFWWENHRKMEFFSWENHRKTIGKWWKMEVFSWENHRKMMENGGLPSGKHTKSYWKWPFIVDFNWIFIYVAVS